MAKLIFVNLPVSDLARATAFYQAVGAEKNEQFCDGTAPPTAATPSMTWSARRKPRAAASIRVPGRTTASCMAAVLRIPTATSGK